MCRINHVHLDFVALIPDDWVHWSWIVRSIALQECGFFPLPPHQVPWQRLGGYDGYCQASRPPRWGTSKCQGWSHASYTIWCMRGRTSSGSVVGLKRAGPLEGGWSRNWNAANKIQIQIITASWVGLDGGWSLYYEGGYSCKTFFRPKIQSKIHTMTTNRAGSAWKCVIHRCYGQGHETNGLLGKTLTQNQGTDIDSGNHFGNEFVCIELFSGPCAVFVIHVPVLQANIGRSCHCWTTEANPDIDPALPAALELPEHFVKLPVSSNLHNLKLIFLTGQPGTSQITFSFGG